MKRIMVGERELSLHISPSFLGNAACPLYLKWHYVDRLDERYVRIGAERGKVAHASIADLLRYALSEEVPVRGIGDDVVRDALLRNIPPELNGETQLVLTWLTKWRDRFVLPRHIHGYEEKVALDDDYDECAWDQSSYRGIIDLREVNGTHAIITDWKSQPNILSPSALEEFDQGKFYCFLTRKELPHIKTFTFRIWYLRYGFYDEVHWTADDIREYETALMIREKKIAEISDWGPIPGPHCTYCDFIHRCPLALDMSPTSPNIITQEQAIVAAQRVVVMEHLIKDFKTKLKVYAQNNDNIRLADNYEFGFKHSVSSIYPPGEVEELLYEHDRKLSEVANVGVKQMNKLLKALAKEDPELARGLEALRQEKHKTEFGGYKVGSRDDEEADL